MYLSIGQIILLMSACLLFAAKSQAMIVGEQLPRKSLGFGLSTFYLQGPDRARQQRYRLELVSLDTFRPNLRWENRFALAPDRASYPSKIGVKENIYELVSAIRATYPYFFRFGFSLGPMLRLENTVLRYNDGSRHERHFNTWSLGWQAAFNLDYVIRDRTELGIYVAYQRRPKAEKADFSVGMNLLFNSAELEFKNLSAVPAPAKPENASE